MTTLHQRSGGKKNPRTFPEEFGGVVRKSRTASNVPVMGRRGTKAQFGIVTREWKKKKRMGHEGDAANRQTGKTGVGAGEGRKIWVKKKRRGDHLKDPVSCT